MKVLLVALLAAGTALAQHGGIRGRGPTYGSSHGFGNIVFPGTGRMPNLPRTASGIGSNPYARGSFAGRLGATIGGYPPYTGGPAGRGRVRTLVVPYTYPVYPFYYQPYQAPANVTIVVPQQPPTVILNQNYTPEVAHPVVREYEVDPEDGIRIYESPRRTSEEPRSAAPRTFLIALKDHTIYNANAYWIDGDTLHYLTTHGSHNQASLDLVDIQLTLQLNQERNVPFRLPRP